MSKERARRRAQREKEKAERARKVARGQRRRAFVRSLVPKPRRRGSGRLYRRSRAQRAGIVVVPVLAAALVWLFVPDVALRIVLTAVIVLVLPALVVALLGRQA